MAAKLGDKSAARENDIPPGQEVPRAAQVVLLHGERLPKAAAGLPVQSPAQGDLRPCQILLRSRHLLTRALPTVGANGLGYCHFLQSS